MQFGDIFFFRYIPLLMPSFHLCFKLRRKFWNVTRFIKSWEVFCHKTAYENCYFCNSNMVKQKADILLYYLPKTYSSYNNLESDLYKDLEEKNILSFNYSCWKVFLFWLGFFVCFGKGGHWCLGSLFELFWFVLNLGILKCLFLLL